MTREEFEKNYYEKATLANDILHYKNGCFDAFDLLFPYINEMREALKNSSKICQYKILGIGVKKSCDCPTCKRNIALKNLDEFVEWKND